MIEHFKRQSFIQDIESTHNDYDQLYPENDSIQRLALIVIHINHKYRQHVGLVKSKIQDVGVIWVQQQGVRGCIGLLWPQNQACRGCLSGITAGTLRSKKKVRKHPAEPKDG